MGCCRDGSQLSLPYGARLSSNSGILESWDALPLASRRGKSREGFSRGVGCAACEEQPNPHRLKTGNSNSREYPKALTLVGTTPGLGICSLGMIPS